MGKGILIITLGVSILTTILMMVLNGNVSDGVRLTSHFFEKTHARLISNSGVEIYLEKLRRNKTLKGNFNNNTLMGGSYDISITGADSLLKISSTATYNGVVHKGFATARRRPVTFPMVKSSLYVSASTLDLHLNGNVDINGNDHRLDGSPGTGAAVPGIGVDSPADSAFVVNDLSTKISKTIKGAGAVPSVRTIPDNTDWLALTKDLIFSADIVLSTGTYSGGQTFGTIAQPKITYVNGNVDFTQASGAGIMIVNGDMKLSGNFNFYGIIIAYGQSSIRTQTIGNNGIYGGTIIVGDDVAIDSQGNSLFYYSTEAINLAKANLKSSRFEILNWWE
ncbi:MAG: hypothetical protein ACM3SM_09855 [Bacteroidota bacterium]